MEIKCQELFQYFNLGVFYKTNELYLGISTTHLGGLKKMNNLKCRKCTSLLDYGRL